MVEEAAKTYRVAYERDESGWWVASVRGVRGCHTQGRTVDEARRRIVEALELFVDNARSATIVDDVKLPGRGAGSPHLYDASQEGRARGSAGCPRRRPRCPEVARRTAEDERT